MKIIAWHLHCLVVWAGKSILPGTRRLHQIYSYGVNTTSIESPYILPHSVIGLVSGFKMWPLVLWVALSACYQHTMTPLSRDGIGDDHVQTLAGFIRELDREVLHCGQGASSFGFLLYMPAHRSPAVSVLCATSAD